jgi:hypothetical protein
MLRILLVLSIALALWNPSQAQDTHEIYLRATVEAIVPLADFSGSIIRVDPDPRFAMTLQIGSVAPVVAGFSKGTPITFAIHSPSLLFAGEPTTGRAYDFSLGRKVEDGKTIFAGLTVIALVPLVPSVQDWQDCKPDGSYSFTDLKQSVRRVVTTGEFWGWDDKVFSRSGDLASVAVLQNFSDKEMTAPEALEGVLLVLRTAFTCPQRCVNANGDQQPRITLLLLDHLRKVASPAMRSKIDEVEKFVAEQARGVE